MSTTPTTDTHDHYTPRMERWLLVMLSSFVPLLGAFFLPLQARIPLFIVGGLIAAVGLVLMVRQTPEAGPVTVNERER